jgi:potassium/hydrogen antiporter
MGMTGIVSFGWVTLGLSLAVVAAILSSRVSAAVRVPAPALFLLGAAVASDLVPALNHLRITTVQNLVTIALVCILFDGGMQIGWRRFRVAAAAVVWLGAAGTFVTAAAVALLAHVALGFGWPAALLLGTALSPTDPAVVFSVLGRREVAGRSGLLLAGESGANDPVGIALMVALLSGTAAGTTGRITEGVLVFVLQMVVGGLVGVLGGLGLRWLMRAVSLPGPALYPLRTLAAAGVLYGLATVAHGSGFLAVFVAGIVVGDADVPYRLEVEGFHSALASLAEIVAFMVLGLTVSLRGVVGTGALWAGLVIAVLLALVIRPVLVGALLAPVRLARGERIFVLWSGLKGAVPVLLGTFAFTAGVPGAARIYAVVFVVVAFSVVVQGGLVPTVARWCRVPMRVVQPRPWAATPPPD